MNFVITEMTFLRYFMPLIIEGNKRGIKSRVFISENNKYNNPLYPNNLNVLHELHKTHNIAVEMIKKQHHIDEAEQAHINKFPDTTFLIEGCGVDDIEYSNKIISFTYMTDFSGIYKKYIDKVDHVVFPSRWCAEHYGFNSDKNIYLGSPKYDVVLNKGRILSKYKLTGEKKKALIVFPRHRDLAKIDLNKIYSFLQKMGYEILVKTRGKDKVQNQKLHGDHYFEDSSWFPHTTMELIEISDIVINFSSATVKECVMLKTPIINFDIKPFKLLLDVLYEFDYAIQLRPDVDFDRFSNVVKQLTSADLKSAFDEAISKYLFDKKGVSKRILDYVL